MRSPDVCRSVVSAAGLLQSESAELNFCRTAEAAESLSHFQVLIKFLLCSTTSKGRSFIVYRRDTPRKLLKLHSVSLLSNLPSRRKRALKKMRFATTSNSGQQGLVQCILTLSPHFFICNATHKHYMLILP